MTINHRDHDHDATREARAACRAHFADREAKAQVIADYFDSFSDGYTDWLHMAALRFDITEGQARDIPKTDRLALASSLLDYFSPDRDEAYLDYRRRNGYTITDSAAAIWSITLHSFS